MSGPFYVAVDIGCLECGEDSAVLGIFTDRVQAEAVLDVARKAQAADWQGQHHFEVFDVAAITSAEASVPS